MTLGEKINYLLANGYIEYYPTSLGRIWINSSMTKQFTVNDIVNCWESIEVF